MSRPKVYITRRIPEQAVHRIYEVCEYEMWDSEEIQVPFEVLLEKVKDVEGIYANVSDRISREVIDAAPDLKVISTMAVGYDNIDVPYAAQKGIRIGHTPDILTETTADLTFALLMATARRIYEGVEHVKQGKWKSWSPMLLTGQDLYQATIGIIGMGRIGEGVARRATGFDMNILYHNRTRNERAEAKLGAVYASKEELLRNSDFVVVLAPGTQGGIPLIGKEELDLMKRTAILINSSRGSNVDEEALYEALKNNRIYAAGLDVFAKEPVSPDHPLLRLPNVVPLPHIGSASIATRINMAVRAADNMICGLFGQAMPSELKVK